MISATKSNPTLACPAPPAPASPSATTNCAHTFAITTSQQRRLFLSSFTISLCPLPLSIFTPQLAHGRGLFQMPPVRLTNRYFLVRAGESKFESLGLINTNPVAKTSMDSGLSEMGKRQTVKAAWALKELKACDGSCWIWPSITQRAYQAAEVIAAINKVDRSHIVPEYSFLDARGLGAYEGKTLDFISEVREIYFSLLLHSQGHYNSYIIVDHGQVYASDGISSDLKPPPIDDGTPNESVSDVFVRVTQLMSVLETQYSGDTVIIVSPDSDNLSILQAGLIGLDLLRHKELSFEPGECNGRSNLLDARSYGRKVYRDRYG